jgi:hypothetical protein
MPVLIVRIGGAENGKNGRYGVTALIAPPDGGGL